MPTPRSARSLRLTSRTDRLPGSWRLQRLWPERASTTSRVASSAIGAVMRETIWSGGSKRATSVNMALLRLQSTEGKYTEVASLRKWHVWCLPIWWGRVRVNGLRCDATNRSHPHPRCGWSEGLGQLEPRAKMAVALYEFNFAD